MHNRAKINRDLHTFPSIRVTDQIRYGSRERKFFSGARKIRAWTNPDPSPARDLADSVSPFPSYPSPSLPSAFFYSSCSFRIWRSCGVTCGSFGRGVTSTLEVRSLSGREWNPRGRIRTRFCPSITVSRDFDARSDSRAGARFNDRLSRLSFTCRCVERYLRDVSDRGGQQMVASRFAKRFLCDMIHLLLAARRFSMIKASRRGSILNELYEYPTEEEGRGKGRARAKKNKFT